MYEMHSIRPFPAILDAVAEHLIPVIQQNPYVHRQEQSYVFENDRLAIDVTDWFSLHALFVSVAMPNMIPSAAYPGIRHYF